MSRHTGLNILTMQFWLSNFDALFSDNVLVFQLVAHPVLMLVVYI
jgi:hypothetical protein